MNAIRGLVRKVRHYGMRSLIACGVDFYIHSDDRRILETVILPYFANGPDYRKVLFVGCEWYTRGYQKLFAGKDYWTLEIDPGQARYGARQHITDSVENVGRHFRAGDLDVIICNGVFGWGLDAPDAVEAAFCGVYHCLREGGVFVLGWNNLPEHTPLPLENVPALQRFKRFVFPPLGSDQFLTEAGRHTYSFYVKA